MDIDEAIRHCYEDAEKEQGCKLKDKSPCASEHIQLAHWLEELKERREKDGYQEK